MVADVDRMVVVPLCPTPPAMINGYGWLKRELSFVRGDFFAVTTSEWAAASANSLPSVNECADFAIILLRVLYSVFELSVCGGSGWWWCFGKGEKNKQKIFFKIGIIARDHPSPQCPMFQQHTCTYEVYEEAVHDSVYKMYNNQCECVFSFLFPRKDFILAQLNVTWGR